MNFEAYKHTGISDASVSQWIGMENVLNQGSPSGFKANLPGKYGVGTLSSGFKLPFVPILSSEVTCYGSIPDALQAGGNIQIPFHPLCWTGDFPSDTIYRYAIPTASLRTVYVPDLKCFVKLNFTGTIGRYTREYDLVKWISAIENSNEIQNQLEQNAANFPFHVLDESHGMFVTSKIFGTFGVGLRNLNTPKAKKKGTQIIPSFSLFCPRKEKKTIASEFVTEVGGSEEDAMKSLLAPLIDTYFRCALGMGLFPEMNAQNVLVELDPEGPSLQVILRDTGDFFKDNTVRRANGQHTRFVDYKMVEKDTVQDFYQRRSFAFDFKLGHYIILPLIDCLASELDLERDRMIQLCKEHVASINGALEYFDSPDYWYRFPKIEDADRGDYEKVTNPDLR